jgi:hypothetical protein
VSQRTKNDSGKNGTSLEIADSVSAKSTAPLRYARHFFKFDGLQRGREVLDSVVCAFLLMLRSHRKSIMEEISLLSELPTSPRLILGAMRESA